MSGIYIHIPFCKQACSYCDFYFVTRHTQRAHFVEALIREIEHYQNHPFSAEKVHTIYFGGGTPSLLKTSELSDIFEALHKAFDLSELKEVTLEMNPDDVNPSYLEDLHNLGINRASMGIQSFNEDLLSFMNRAHTSEEAIKSLEYLATSGFKTYTVDLIYGNPGQSLSMLEKDIDTLIKFEPPHVSAYSLTIESKTRLGKQVELGRIRPPDDEETSKHFDMVIDKLDSESIEQYEVSNYARAGHEAVHNSNYWAHHNYLGLGPAAHSFWRHKQTNIGVRWSNKADLKEYISGEAGVLYNKEDLSLNTLAEEHIMLGLRTRKGISEEHLRSVYSYSFADSQLEFISHMKKAGYIEDRSGVVLSRKGIHIADTITVDLISKK